MRVRPAVYTCWLCFNLSRPLCHRAIEKEISGLDIDFSSFSSLQQERKKQTHIFFLPYPVAAYYTAFSTRWTVVIDFHRMNICTTLHHTTHSQNTTEFTDSTTLKNGLSNQYLTAGNLIQGANFSFLRHPTLVCSHGI